MLITQTEKGEEEESKRRESRYIEKDGEGNLQGLQKAAYTSLFEQVLQEGFYNMAAHCTCCIDAEDRMRKSYREYVNDFLTVADGLISALGLTSIPHFTTIEKFMLRVSPMLLERVLGGFMHLTRTRY